MTDNQPTVLPRIGAQILSVRHVSDSFEARIEAVAEIGYRGVEMINWGRQRSPDPAIVTAEEARDILTRHGVTPVASHMPTLSVFKQDFDEVLDYQETIGNRYLIVPFIGEEVGYSTENAEVWAAFGKQLKSLSARCKDRGFFLGIHNHVLELLPVEGRLGLLRIFDELEPEDLFWEADIGHIAGSHLDVINLFAEIGERCHFVHVKDLNAEVNSNPVLEGDGRFSNFEELTAPIRQRMEWEVELGEGVIDLDEIVELSISYGVDWLLSEIHKPGLDAKQAYGFLSKKLTAVT